MDSQSGWTDIANLNHRARLSSEFICLLIFLLIFLDTATVGEHALRAHSTPLVRPLYQLV
jgi:hypothetical protein